MKSFFKFIIGSVLMFRARRFLKKHHVQVIAVTGSVGKTSTKEAIYTVLKSKFDVERSKKSFNTPIGMSLAILGEETSGFSSPKAWLKILFRVFFKEPKAPAKMVLEMGADAPGNIRQLMKIAPPHISVVTAVQAVHLGAGQFDSLEQIAEEKSTLVRCLPASGIAILNQDDLWVRQMKTPAKKVTFSVGKKADLRALRVRSTAKGLRFEVAYKKDSVLCEVPLIGHFQAYVCLPAIAVGLSLGMSLKACCEALSNFSLPPGRMNPIEGLNGALVIDSSYNASPAAMQTALEVLGKMKSIRKIAALGTMNELGDMTFEAHTEVGKRAAQIADLIVAVGPEAQAFKQGAIVGGMNAESVFTFVTSLEAGQFLAKKIQKGDVILVKGSQNHVRMERLVKEIMQDSSRAAELLCRQDMAWSTLG